MIVSAATLTVQWNFTPVKALDLVSLLVHDLLIERQYSLDVRFPQLDTNLTTARDLAELRRWVRNATLQLACKLKV